jgi:hypothetical protein
VDDTYRAIVIAPTQGDTYLLMHVDHHDKAYRWCKNKRFEIHQATGVLQVFDVEEVNAVAEQTKPHFQAVSSYPLQKLSDHEIFHAGVPTPLIPAVRVIQSDGGGELLLTQSHSKLTCDGTLDGILVLVDII